MTTERIVISVNESGSRVVRRNIEGIGAGATRAQGAVQLLQRALLTLGVGALLTSVNRTLANFSQEMSTVKAITASTESQFMLLREEAKRLGAETRFSASQAAEGMTFLARAGFDVSEIMKSTSDTLLLAQAGALGLGSAADIASNILTGFRMEAEEMGRVVDVLAKGANSANTSVAQLGEGMKFVAPVAAGLSVSLEEATAAVGALSDAGLQGSMAGTGLRRVLSELENPAKKTVDILAELGLTTDEVRISTVGLTGALDALHDAGVDTGLALEIFGDRGGPAFEVLSQSIPRVKELTETLRDSEGAALAMAEIMDDNLNGALLSVVSATESLVIAFGDLGAEATLKVLFRTLADLIRAIANNLEDLATAVTTWVPLMVYYFRVQLVGAVLAARNAVLALNAAIIANPLGALAVAITSVLSLLVFFRDSIQLSGERLATLGDLGRASMELIGERVATFITFFNENFGVIAEFASSVFGSVSLSIEGVLRTGARVLDALIGLWIGSFNTIVTYWRSFPVVINDIMILAINSTINLLEGLNNYVVGVLNSILSTVTEIQIPLLELPKLQFSAAGGAADLGEAVREGFIEGLSLGLVEAELDSLLERAEASALKRQEVERERLQSLESMSDEIESLITPSDLAKRRGLGDDDEAEGPTFEELVADLRIEAELLRLTSRERAVRLTQLQTEGQLQRDLTQSEADLVEELARENLVLSDQARLYEEIRGPMIQHEANLNALEQLHRDGRITLEEYIEKVEELKEALADDEELITFMDGVRDGLERVSEQANDLAGQVSNVVVGAFNSAEDAMVQFATTGKLEFKALVDSILEDIARIMIRQAIIGPIAGALGTAFMPAAQGAVVGGGTTPFARGGVVDQPTVFPFARGVGLMGEAGPEAIMPLSRLPSGDLGVKVDGNSDEPRVTVNVIDQRSAGDPPAEVRERVDADGGRVIDVVIQKAVQSTINSGGADKALRNRFDLRPRATR